jgi:hypothetical protein
MSLDRRQRLDALDFVWDPLAAQWEEGCRSLEIFRQREGHCRVPHDHREHGFRLGQWVSVQRSTRDAMSPDHRQRLDALSFVWDPYADRWEEGFGYLERYRKDQGNCLMPHSYRDPISGYRLGSWVTNQRTAQNTMPPERRQRLDALGFVWDRLAVQWEEGFRCLERYRKGNGDALVPKTYRDPASGYRLGQWVSVQRRDKETLSPERRQRLDTLDFVWDPWTTQWEEGFGYLERYRKGNGDALVPKTYRDPASGYRLGQWVSVQRRTRDAMSPDHRQRLDALGFVWNSLTTEWEEGFRSLAIFRQREGHCRVPQKHREQGFRLGQWVSNQRARADKETMPPDRRQRLDALGFVWKVR